MTHSLSQLESCGNDIAFVSYFYPFNSYEIREALVEIINCQHDEQKQQLNDKRTPDICIPIRGKFRGAVIEKSEEDSQQGEMPSGDSLSCVSESDSSSSSLSSSEIKIEAVNLSTVSSHMGSKKIRSNNATAKPHKIKNKSKMKNKRSRDEIISKLLSCSNGTPLPSIFLPLPTKSATFSHLQQQRQNKSRLAVQIPRILLPLDNNLRSGSDNHGCCLSIATSLLTTWDRMNNFNCGNATHHLNKTASCVPNSTAVAVLNDKSNGDQELSLSPTILIILIQSGRFAAAVFSSHQPNPTLNNHDFSSRSATMEMIAHKTSTRYTVRKGQGGSQSNHDQSRNKAKSMGAQLRREGERQLMNDVLETWKEWKIEGYVKRSMGVYASCPKRMSKDYLYGGGVDCGRSSNDALLEKGDVRWRNIPLDVGRPTLEAVAAVMECIMRCNVIEIESEKNEYIVQETNTVKQDLKSHEESSNCNGDAPVNGKQVFHTSTLKGELKANCLKENDTLTSVPPFTQLHEAVIAGNLPKLIELLEQLEELEEKDIKIPSSTFTVDSTTSPTDCDTFDQSQSLKNSDHPQEYDVNTRAGPDYQTALHLASSSLHDEAPSFVKALMLQGHANPCIMDSHGRPPYYVATSDKLRDTFRLARGTLGEHVWAWDEGAKVGPALTEEELELKKTKALDKKRRQRARQKEKKAIEKEKEAEAAAKEARQEEERKREENAKRLKDGLQPKSISASNSCDYCQAVVKGKRRSQMFHRLDYAYCSTECVKQHQRELVVAAAVARMGLH